MIPRIAYPSASHPRASDSPALAEGRVASCKSCRRRRRCCCCCRRRRRRRALAPITRHPTRLPTACSACSSPSAVRHWRPPHRRRILQEVRASPFPRTHNVTLWPGTRPAPSPTSAMSQTQLGATTTSCLRRAVSKLGSEQPPPSVTTHPPHFPALISC